MVLAVFVLSKVRIMGVRCEFMIRLEVEQSRETKERNSRLLLLVIPDWGHSHLAQFRSGLSENERVVVKIIFNISDYIWLL